MTTPTLSPITRVAANLDESIERNLKDYLEGYIRNNPSNQAHVVNYQDWRRMARLELDRRATGFLVALPDDELAAIADGQIDLIELARNLSA